MASIDTPQLLHYKVHMKITKKAIWPLIILALSACQAIPASRPTSTPNISTEPAIIPTTSPTETPFPTPVPVIRVESGDRALFYGEYDAARVQYTTAFNEAKPFRPPLFGVWGEQTLMMGFINLPLTH